MSRVVLEEITIHASPDEVWRVAGDPGTISEWVPALAGSTLTGDERHCTTGDGAHTSERIVRRSDAERSYTYEIVESPMPLRSYRSTIAVEGHGDHSHVRWQAEFETLEEEQGDEVEAAITGIYRDGLSSLRDRIEAVAVS